MAGFFQFVVATALILASLFIFVVILAAGWLVGTVYLWAEGAGEESQKPVKRLTWWNKE